MQQKNVYGAVALLTGAKLQHLWQQQKTNSCHSQQLESSPEDTTFDSLFPLARSEKQWDPAISALAITLHKEVAGARIYAP